MDHIHKKTTTENKAIIKEIFCILGQLIIAWIVVDIIKLLFCSLLYLIETYIPGFLNAVISLIFLLLIVNAD